MKVFIALLALVAVSQAAFTGTLQQRTQPLIDQTMFKMQLANARSSRGIADVLMSLMGNQIAAIQAEIDSQVAAAHGHAMSLIQNLHLAATSIGMNPDTLINMLPQSIQDYVNTAIGKPSRAGISGIFEALQNHFQPQIQDALDTANQLAQQLTIPNLLNWLQGQLMSRGFFGNIWGAITGAVGNAWDTASNVVSGAWDSATDQAMTMWQDFSNTATSVGSVAMNQVSAMAGQFINEAQTNIGQMTAASATQFSNFMSQWKDQLGTQWDDLQAQVATIVANENNAGKRF